MTAVLMLTWMSLLCGALGLLALDMSRRTFTHRVAFFGLMGLALAVQLVWGMSL